MVGGYHTKQARGIVLHTANLLLDLKVFKHMVVSNDAVRETLFV